MDLSPLTEDDKKSLSVEGVMPAGTRKEAGARKIVFPVARSSTAT
jgi:hypothetical protein